AHAVDVESEGARRIGRDRMSVGGGTETRHHAQHLLIVASGRDGQAEQRSGSNLGAHFGAIGLQGSRLSGNADGFTHRADFVRHTSSRVTLLMDTVTFISDTVLKPSRVTLTV